MSSRGPPVVLDATVLSNFAVTGTVGWLADVLTTPVTVPAVRQEIRDGYDEGYGYLDAALSRFTLVDNPAETADGSIGVVPLDGSPRADAPALMQELDRGEAHALYRAAPEWMLATDDRDARQAADERDVPLTGSIGILAYGVEQHELSVDTADDWLGVWRRHGYHSPVESVRELLADG